MPTNEDERPGADLEIVRALLGGAGLVPPEDEVERLAELYPGIRRSIERFYAVDVGDEVMAAVFRADAAAGAGGRPGGADGS